MFYLNALLLLAGHAHRTKGSTHCRWRLLKGRLVRLECSRREEGTGRVAGGKSGRGGWGQEIRYGVGWRLWLLLLVLDTSSRCKATYKERLKLTLMI